MARIEEKIAEIADPALRQAIDEEVKALKKNKQFGLVFETHSPEVVPMPRVQVKRDATVAKKAGKLTEVWQVVRVQGDTAELIRDGLDGKPVHDTAPIDSLLVVRRMAEPIFPALQPVASVHNGPADAPHHLLIEADNYHALQLLAYAYAGKVDCIYIDPPYNTGARDWKYNNDYVDANDTCRHSKWLAMMQRRLQLAKQLLNPADSVLIVTIDEKEVLRLGLLLEQVFPNCKVQKTTIVINPKGTARYNEFSRVEEYAFFVFIGEVKICPFGSDLLTNRDYSSETHVRWRGLARTGRKGLRSNNPGSWYPIFLRTSDYSIHSIGDPLSDGETEASVQIPKGTISVWPPSKNGKQYSWGNVPATLRQIWSKGGFKTGFVKPERQQYPFYYLSSGLFQKIDDGLISVIGRGNQNELLLQYVGGQKQAMPRSVWNRVEYDAGSHGTGVLQSVLGDSSFPFPKSLYAVRDSIRLFMEKKKDALILDFFAGSGTTLNAVNLLNATDGGQRRCIVVTNNEVSADESAALIAQGLQPGDAAWEAQGICRSVTWPRSKFTILGKRDDGTLLAGEYQTGHTVSKEKERNIRQLGFANGNELTLPQRKQLAALMPALPQSKLEAKSPWFLDDDLPVSVLWDVHQAEVWLDELADADHLTDVYVVTTETRLFTALSKKIKETLGPMIVDEEEKRPMSAGFPANLDYFKLDFLEPSSVALGRQFEGILPILWMMAGSRGTCPQAPENGYSHLHWLIPDGNPFAVLMRETRFREFLTKLAARPDLTHIFLVTNSDRAFHDMKADLPDHLTVTQLYKSYLDNFKINIKQAQGSKQA